jgi:predicted nucleic acid-binding protein
MMLDTDIMVDILRGFPPAVAWLNALGATAVGLPGLVAMELLQGCRNRGEQQGVEAELHRFSLHWPTVADCTRALADFAASHLSHSLGLLDSLIAETAVGLGRPLATFNIKHYAAIPAVQTVQPY